MSAQRRRIVRTDAFDRDFRAVRGRYPRAKDFLEGLLFYLERDPSVGCIWGSGPVWYLSSVGQAKGLPGLTVFYTFDDESVSLHCITEVAIL
jgi:hypothetical protein